MDLRSIPTSSDLILPLDGIDRTIGTRSRPPTAIDTMQAEIGTSSAILGPQFDEMTVVPIPLLPGLDTRGWSR